MPAEAWPEGVPFLDFDPSSITLLSNVVMSDVDNGPPERRPRFTTPRFRASVTWKGDGIDTGAFSLFFIATLQFGTKPFVHDDPFSDTPVDMIFVEHELSFSRIRSSPDPEDRLYELRTVVEYSL